MNGFLLDENLPRQLRFQPTKPVIHVAEIGKSSTDSHVWAYAQNHGLAIVSKDADFSERILLSEPPPWVVHLRFGNLCRAEFHTLLERAWPQVESWLEDCKLVNVYIDRIEGVL